MRKCVTSVIVPAAVSLLSSVATFAPAHAQQTAIAIPDNDSVYVDAKSFQVVPGKGKGEAGAQIKDLGARELGPGAIIIRSGNKLYIAEGQTLRPRRTPIRGRMCERGTRNNTLEKETSSK